jgi:hypothetical protein
VRDVEPTLKHVSDGNAVDVYRCAKQRLRPASDPNNHIRRLLWRRERQAELLEQLGIELAYIDVDRCAADVAYAEELAGGEQPETGRW